VVKMTCDETASSGAPRLDWDLGGWCQTAIWPKNWVTSNVKLQVRGLRLGHIPYSLTKNTSLLALYQCVRCVGVADLPPVLYGIADRLDLAEKTLTSSSYRYYTDGELARLEKIGWLKELELTLDEIDSLIDV
jgi:MerR HTH family regulatory protein